MTAKKLSRILHVEDEPDILAVVQLALEVVGGYKVLSVGSGAQALLDAAAFAPDLLLLDVMMPGMDGPTTLAQLRALPPLAETPAVFMTAKVQDAEVAYLKSLGALDVIRKPFDPMQLAVQVQKIWEQEK